MAFSPPLLLLLASAVVFRPTAAMGIPASWRRLFGSLGGLGSDSSDGHEASASLQQPSVIPPDAKHQMTPLTPFGHLDSETSAGGPRDVPASGAPVGTVAATGSLRSAVMMPTALIV